MTDSATPATISTTASTFVRRLDSVTKRIALPSWFAAGQQPVEVELGSGDGSFLAAWAAANRGTNFLGIERLMGRLRKLDRKVRVGRLENVSLLRVEAAYLLEYLISPGAIQAVHVYFPDPWPKKRHWKNRLVNERFPLLASRALAPGGRVYLRTDNEPYFTQMTEVFAASPLFEKVETPAPLAAVVTDFERNFNAQGIPTLRATYQLR